jgi:hypothetical protein
MRNRPLLLSPMVPRLLSQAVAEGGVCGFVDTRMTTVTVSTARNASVYCTGQFARTGTLARSLDSKLSDSKTLAQFKVLLACNVDQVMDLEEGMALAWGKAFQRPL